MMCIKNFVLFMLILAGTTVGAQNNIIKAGLTGAFLGDINVGFEQKLKKNTSLQFKIGYLDPMLSPAISKETISFEGYDLLESNGGISTSIEYRLYLSKRKGLEGFYLAPYFRYFNQKMLFNDAIEDNEFSVDARLSTIGLGGQMGYQWILNEVFTIDFFFFGSGIDFYKTVLKYRLNPEPEGFDYSIVTPHVDDVFSDIEYLHKKLVHTVNEDNHTTKLPFLFPGFRGGISVGVAF